VAVSIIVEITMSMQESPQSGNMSSNTSPRHRVKATLDSINRGISSSFFGRFWRLEGSGHVSLILKPVFMSMEA
jgi:hypothetical protein